MKFVEEQLFKIIFYFESGAITDFDIMQWATGLALEGSELESIIKLASVMKHREDEVKVLFRQSIKDMGFDYPSKQELGFYRAKVISERIINGKMPPYKGCLLISSICSDLDLPEILSDFMLLNHKASGHEEFGITKEGLSKDIISAALKLIDNVNLELNLK
jgi:hypothetical protein